MKLMLKDDKNIIQTSNEQSTAFVTQIGVN